MSSITGKILASLFCLFVLQQTLLFSQGIIIPKGSSLDTSIGKGGRHKGNKLDTINKGNKWAIGLYFSPTASFNLGEKAVPYFIDGADCNCSVNTGAVTERGSFGQSVGFNIVSKTLFKKIKINTGIAFENFHYKGSAQITRTEYKPPYSSGTFEFDYSYLDLFIHLPILFRYEIISWQKNELQLIAGASFSSFFRENWFNDSWWLSEFYTYKSWHFKHNWASFGIVGINFSRSINRNHVLELGPELKYALTTTPKGRRFASAGITFGILF